MSDAAEPTPEEENAAGREHVTRELLARELLAPLRDTLLYKDRQELRKGSVERLARRLRRRARVQMGLGSVFGAFMVVQGLITLVEYPSSDSTFNLVFGILAVAFGLALSFFWTRHSTQMESRAALVVEMLERRRES